MRWAVALLNPINIMMLALSICAGLVAAWWLFPVGLVCWSLMVLSVARDPALRITDRIQSRQPLAYRFQAGFDRLQRTQVTLFSTIAAARVPVRNALKPVQVEADRLVERIHDFCVRMGALENLRVVSEYDQRNSDKSAASLPGLIAETADPVARQAYEETQLAVTQQQAKLQQIAAVLKRADAVLLSAATELDTALADIVSLQALEPAEIQSRVPEVVARLQRRRLELDALDRGQLSTTDTTDRAVRVASGEAAPTTD